MKLLLLSLPLAASFVANPHCPAVFGYDVVAYQTLDYAAPPKDGSPDHVAYLATSTGNYTFWFASEENRAAFAGNPWKYAPRFGGFCTVGVQWAGDMPWGPKAPEAKADFLKCNAEAPDWQVCKAPNPHGFCVNGSILWQLHNETLYFTGCGPNKTTDPEVRRTAITPEVVERATKKWISMFGALEDGPFNIFAYEDGENRGKPSNFGVCAFDPNGPGASQTLELVV
mmetsp:Transcript_89440/g.158754  ORF Transcript_89440/g.158754 Transcript_89440/m.158754 type:complete len:227 (-) Transcript_89440:151-831(-)